MTPFKVLAYSCLEFSFRDVAGSDTEFRNNQTQYVVDDAVLLDLYPNVPTQSALVAFLQPQSIWLKESALTQPYYLQSSISVERSLPRNVTLSLSYPNTRGLHQLRARNINAPVTPLGPQPFPTGTTFTSTRRGRPHRLRDQGRRGGLSLSQPRLDHTGSRLALLSQIFSITRTKDRRLVT